MVDINILKYASGGGDAIKEVAIAMLLATGR